MKNNRPKYNKLKSSHLLQCGRPVMICSEEEEEQGLRVAEEEERRLGYGVVEDEEHGLGFRKCGIWNEYNRAGFWNEYNRAGFWNWVLE